jgi:hypothetical protein
VGWFRLHTAKVAPVSVFDSIPLSSVSRQMSSTIKELLAFKTSNDPCSVRYVVISSIVLFVLVTQRRGRVTNKIVVTYFLPRISKNIRKNSGRVVY